MMMKFKYLPINPDSNEIMNLNLAISAAKSIGYNVINLFPELS